MLDKPLYKSVPTFRTYEDYHDAEQYTKGWNDAMDYIFPESKKARDREAVRKNLKLLEAESDVRKPCINYEDGCEEWAGCPCILLALLGRRLPTFAHGYKKGLEDAEKIRKMEEKTDEEKDRRKQLRDLYDEFVRETWSESEDIRGNNMIQIKTARQILWDLLCELGVWDEGEKPEV